MYWIPVRKPRGTSVERITLLLSTAEHAASFTTAYEEADEAWTDAKEELLRHREHLESTSQTLFSSLTEIYSALLLEIFTAPNVQEAFIYSRNFLPYIDGKRFDTVSISGGNRVPFIVGYWLALQTVALSSPQYPFPGFLILDSPQKSLGPLQELSRKMYRQIEAMAAEREETFQIFVLDTNLPSGFTPFREPMQLTYRNPGIRSIRHPGPGAVYTVEGEPVAEPGTE